MAMPTRKEIQDLKERFLKEYKIVLNEDWKKIYENLICALDHLDASIERCTVYTCPKCEPTISKES